MSEQGQVAGTEENVVIEAGGCAVTLLPQFGGKIASIQVNGRELLQQPLAPVAPRTQTMSFDAGDASGWDECLPSVAACSVEFADGTVEIPDHGDLWRVEWKDRDQRSENRDQENTVALYATCFSLPLEMERTLSLEENDGGWRLELQYGVTNFGSVPAPWSWGAHPLFLAEAGDRIVLPESVRTLRVEGSGGGRLGKNGDTVSWPVAKLADGGETDLSAVLAADSGVGDSYSQARWARRKTGANWCGPMRAYAFA